MERSNVWVNMMYFILRLVLSQLLDGNVSREGELVSRKRRLHNLSLIIDH